MKKQEFEYTIHKAPSGEEYIEIPWVPLHDRVYVKRLEKETRHGNIWLPDVAQETSRFAEVLAVGPGRWINGVFTKTAVKPGDVVLLPGIAAKIPDWEEHDRIFVQEADIGAIIG